jgi:hypothetical protein
VPKPAANTMAFLGTARLGDNFDNAYIRATLVEFH